MPIGICNLAALGLLDAPRAPTRRAEESNFSSCCHIENLRGNGDTTKQQWTAFLFLANVRSADGTERGGEPVELLVHVTRLDFNPLFQNHCLPFPASFASFACSTISCTAAVMDVTFARKFFMAVDTSAAASSNLLSLYPMLSQMHLKSRPSKR